MYVSVCLSVYVLERVCVVCLCGEHVCVSVYMCDCVCHTFLRERTCLCVLSVCGEHVCVYV